MRRAGSIFLPKLAYGVLFSPFFHSPPKRSSGIYGTFATMVRALRLVKAPWSNVVAQAGRTDAFLPRARSAPTRADGPGVVSGASLTRPVFSVRVFRTDQSAPMSRGPSVEGP